MSKPPPERADAVSRCPACQQMVQEGSSHTCPAGRHRKVFENPPYEKTDRAKYQERS